MGKNVIILGAGFSYDARVPLLSGFVETMWHLAHTKSCYGVPLAIDDVHVFEDAIKVGTEIESFHSRAKFDDRNIEDILSLLSFAALAGSEKAQAQLAAMTKAITRTIELTCNVKHPGVPKPEARFSITNERGESYRRFWSALLNWYSSGEEMPTIITFNYDLVLERSLLQLLISLEFVQGEVARPIRNIRVNYHYENVPEETWVLKPCHYGNYGNQRVGTKLEKTSLPVGDEYLEIEILKLHGSVNFPRAKLENEADYNIAEALSEPYILPPIFNKLSASASNPSEMWKAALHQLSSANNVVIVGYSLPQTDIYMQYFLKAAVGPNTQLNRIFVFDPVLTESSPACEEMKERYNLCFSEQLRKRLVYPLFFGDNHGDLGKTTHFLRMLATQPKSLLY